MRRYLFWGLCASLLWTTAPIAAASDISTKYGGYSDNQGLNQSRFSLGLGIDTKHDGLLSGTSHSVTVVQEGSVQKPEATAAVGDEAGETRSTNQSLSLVSSQTWAKLTETRVASSISSSRNQGVTSRSYGAGVSQWIWSESIRLSLDVSRNLVEQPEQEYLDYDSELITIPNSMSSTGYVASLRHLATTSTIVDYTVGFHKSETRPWSSSLGLNVRQYIPYFSGAIHAGVGRAINRGKMFNESIGSETNYGAVDAWMGTIAYLQSLWTGATGRVAYRYYKENETTRAFGDELVFGSDLYTVAVSQSLAKGIFEQPDTSLILDASTSLYQTNKDNNAVDIDNREAITANIYELGLTAKF